MISFGDLNAGHTGTFTIPPRTDLRNYSRIDVSLQPFNGGTVHVKTGVVRGSAQHLARDRGACPRHAPRAGLVRRQQARAA